MIALDRVQLERWQIVGGPAVAFMGEKLGPVTSQSEADELLLSWPVAPSMRMAPIATLSVLPDGSPSSFFMEGNGGYSVGVKTVTPVLSGDAGCRRPGGG